MFERSHIEKLTEESQEFENTFLSPEPLGDGNEPVLSDFPYYEEYDFLIAEYKEKSRDPLSDSFDYEWGPFKPLCGNLIDLGEEDQIREREHYEITFIMSLNPEFYGMELPDGLNRLTEEIGTYHCDTYEDDWFDEDYADEPEYLNRPSCGYDVDYLPNDDTFDFLDCYDYPEGPSENLDGVMYPW